MAKTTKTTSTAKKVSSEIDLFSNTSIPARAKRQIREEVGELLKDQILIAVGNQSSPIVGEKWPGISKSYKAFKKSQNLPGKVNMEFSGSMLDSLNFKPTTKGIEIGVFGSDAGKAEGHNNFDGGSSLPQRRFLPDEGQNFKRNITSTIDRIISDASLDKTKITRGKLSGVETKSQLFEFIASTFPSLTRLEAKESILGDESLVKLFNSLNLLRFF